MKDMYLFIAGCFLGAAIWSLFPKEQQTFLTERDYRVYQVYFSKGDGPGTLRHAMKQEGPMQILFDFYEGGVIDVGDTIHPTTKSQVIKK